MDNERLEQIEKLIPGIAFDCSYVRSFEEVYKNGYNSGSFTRHEYEVTVLTDSGSYTTSFTQGEGCKEDPNLVSVLYCLLSDAQAVEYHDQEEFLIEFGYAESPELLRKGFKAFKGCQETREALDRIGILDHLEELNEIFQDY